VWNPSDSFYICIYIQDNIWINLIKVSIIMTVQILTL